MRAPNSPAALFKVERGQPSEHDLAALVAVIAQLRQRPEPVNGPAAKERRPTWRRPERRPYYGVPTSWNAP
ncbi:MAG: acyl-CoA carboxylase subunit epsilon [Streptomyces sp.]|nr:acyl-CoA carboxylase subunit epsilon [Streptomyces sp.]